MVTIQDIVNKLTIKHNKPIEQLLTPTRIIKLEKLLSENRFDDTLYRLVLEHNNQDYKEKFYHNGYYNIEPNNKLGFLLLYIVVIGGDILTTKKNNVLKWGFCGYIFEFVFNNKENFVNLHVYTSEKNGHKKILSL